MAYAPSKEVEIVLLGRSTTRIVLPTTATIPEPTRGVVLPTKIMAPSPCALTTLVLRAGLALAGSAALILATAMASKVPIMAAH